VPTSQRWQQSLVQIPFTAYWFWLVMAARYLDLGTFQGHVNFGRLFISSVSTLDILQSQSNGTVEKIVIKLSYGEIETS